MSAPVTDTPGERITALLSDLQRDFGLAVVKIDATWTRFQTFGTKAPWILDKVRIEADCDGADSPRAKP